MKPISPNILNLSSTGTCIQTSSSCVIWNGPNIPCINLCKGDSIDTVIYELAQILCDITENVLDVTTLDFACLIGPGDCPPETLLETLQAIITKVCSLPTSSGPCPPPSNLPIVNLPPCLYYTDLQGDNVTALPLDEYASYLASTICRIIADINSINSVIATINNRLTILELNAGAGGGGTPVTTITSQCYTGTAPGQTVALSTALTNMETKLCQYNNLLGTLTEWQSVISSTCITGSTPLPCGTGTYSSLPGWVDPVETVADSLKNLWLVVCKLNSCITVPSTLPCVLVPPTNVTITDVTNTACKINWTAPVTTGVTAPTAYKIEVFDALGTPPAIVTVNVGTTPTPLTYNLASASIVAGTTYLVKVSAIYPCGTSAAATATGVLKQVYYASKLYYQNTITSSSAEICGITNAYTEVTRKLRVELRDPATSNPVLNTISGSGNIEVTVRIQTIGCGGTVTTTDQIIPIAPNQWFGEVTFVAQEKTLCGIDCQDITRSVTCYVGTQITGGTPLPPTVGLDTSITSLTTC